MSNVAISVQNVGKTFLLQRHSARQAIENAVRGPFRKKVQAADPYAEGFWALRDVSFEIGKGEVVGLVGRNGAGKSVLLKLISRVMRPTHGRIEVIGRVAPLLEVGTGFHPELTGRENIDLNGVILGMRRKEVRHHIDQIVEFADIGGFLDTPIKRYSSGMRMRLAFAVAAHLDRDIFLLDEILTVGDYEFQQKCLDRLQTLASEGRTVLIVNHGDGHMERFCSRAILFDRGQLIASGTPEEITERYERLRHETPAVRG